jgi:two-component system KDP operon response regulator KdpE
MRPGLSIDKPNRAVWVDGTRVVITGQSYDLLYDLYTHANQLCTRQEIVERVFQEVYDETDPNQTSRLNTAIHRLRDKIEKDPSQPRYLRTDPGGGYRFVP